MVKKICTVFSLLMVLLPFSGVYAITSSMLPADTIVTDTLLRTGPQQSPQQDRTQRQTVAQEDTLPVSAIKWYREEQLQNPFQLRPNYIDTTLLNVQHYDFADRESIFYAEKANTGLTYRPLIYNPDLRRGIIFGQYNNYGQYIFNHEDLVYYRPDYVFTELYLVTGAEREQIFSALHNQKLAENLFMGFQYRVVNSPGAYTGQASRNNTGYFTADYMSDNKRYQILASFIINQPNSQESGGLRNYQTFEENTLNDSVYLFEAESRYRDISVNFRHFYQTGFYAGRDSVNEGRFVNLGRINHDFSYHRFSFVFQEDDEPYPFYEADPFYEEQTFDSTLVNKVENQFSWSNFPLQGGRFNFPFNFKLYLRHTLYAIEQPNYPEDQPLLDTLGNPLYYYQRQTYNQFVQGAEISSDQNKLLSFGGYANLTVGGYNDEDFHAGGHVNFGRPEQKFRLEGTLDFASMEAPYFLNRFSGNYIEWDNDFDKMQIVNTGGVLRTPWVDLNGNYYLINNFVYVDDNALPSQNTSTFSFFSLAVRSDLESRLFGLRNHIIFQQSTSSRFLRFPTLMSYHSAYIKMNWFQGALIHRFGFDFHFNTSYRIMSYQPVIRDFHVQNTFDGRNKYLLDVFWSAKIKRARLFVKYEHLLGLIPDFLPFHYDIAFYPYPTGMFKFGVSWMFYN